jgi:site-specific DNA-methyltransferase (adenine-specific)/adenine-specific DNA-methyltransferase
MFTIKQGNSLELIEEIADESVDLIVCDGPYGATPFAWDRINNIQEYNLNLIKLFTPKLKVGGSLYLFGKMDSLDFVDYRPFLKLINRIVWYQPSRLGQGRQKWTNNYDTIHYLSKGVPKTFNLDSVRVPQLVELEQRRRCENVPSVRSGKFSKTKFNPLGKNPGDVWGDIKQLTYKSKELVGREFLNTIQKPEKLIERLVLASSNRGEVVLDPFMGTGTTAVVCQNLDRQFIGFEIDNDLVKISEERLQRSFKPDIFSDVSTYQDKLEFRFV